MSSKKKPSFISRAVYRILRFFSNIKYKKTRIVGLDSLPEGNSIIIANHAQLNGPIIAELCMPENCYIWANGQMFNYKEVPDYAMADFFPYKKGWTRIFYRIASFLMAPLMPCVMKNARAIPVYHDARMAYTIKQTMRKLSRGGNIIIFPEAHIKKNNIVNEFRNQFVDIAKMYHRRTGVAINFIPMYIAPSLSSCYLGEAIAFNPEADIDAERVRIAEYLSNSITEIARSLPEHTVIPFDNISFKDYPLNTDFKAMVNDRR